MKEATVKLSGHSKDKFLERFFAAETELDAGARLRLIARSKASFTSLRVRKALLAPQRKTPIAAATAPRPSTPAETVGRAAVSSPAPAPAEADAAFDPYMIGLVPVFQREGREGLLARLASVTRLDHLRQMAKSQQVVLPQPLRAGDATLDAVREAIADAVAKRIADRRAAAG